MKFLNQIERRMGRFAIRNLMKYLCIAMLGVFILEYLPLKKSAVELMYFDRELILKGEIWRLITFLFVPPTGSLIWILFNLYFYYFLGTALEQYWGSTRFTLYYLIGVIGAVAGGMIAGVGTNQFLNLSLLLSYSVLNPEMEFMLFFFVPVKAKWLGWAWGAYFVYELIVLPWTAKPLVLLSLLPFFLFFGKQAYLQAGMDLRRLRRWIRLKMQK